MKQIILLLALVLFLVACPMYDSLPEPELPLLGNITFVQADYYTGSRSIYLKFASSVSYDGIYPFYNKNKDFSMAYYLKNSDLVIISTDITKNGAIEGITVYLAADITSTVLNFDTNNPLYFYKVKKYNHIIEAKAYIGTPSLTVNIIP